jgi:hypothetical protein
MANNESQSTTLANKAKISDLLPKLSSTELVQESFSSSRPGCFQIQKGLVDWDCSQQKLQIRLLIQLYKKKVDKDKALVYLNYLVLKRVKYFLSIGEFDYQSIISLVMFPIPRKKEILNIIFQSTPPELSQMKDVVFHKIDKKSSPICLSGLAQSKKGKVLPLFVQEICSLKIL